MIKKKTFFYRKLITIVHHWLQNKLFWLLANLMAYTEFFKTICHKYEGLWMAFKYECFVQERESENSALK